MSIRIQAVLSLLVLVVTVLVAQEAYRYVAYRDERAALRALREDIVEAGADVARVEARIDTLQRRFGYINEQIDFWRRRLDAARPTEYGTFLTALEQEKVQGVYDEYNRWVREHNELLGVYQRRRMDLDRERAQYYALADSARDLAAILGDPYYRVPTVAQAAQERGIK